MGAHFLMWLGEQIAKLNGQQHTDSGWQRNPPAQQETGGYQLPNLLEGIANGPAWHGPTHTWTEAYMQEHQRGNTPIPATRQDTPGEVPRAPLLSARQVYLSTLETTPSLRDKPEWLRGLVPGQDLPVVRQQSVSRPLIPVELPPFIGQPLSDRCLNLAKEQELDEMLQTMRESNSQKLPPPWISPAEDVIYELPTVKPTQDQADAWLNSAVLPPLPDVPADELAVADKSNTFEVTEEMMQPDLTSDDPEGTAQPSALWKLQHCEHLKL